MHLTLNVISVCTVMCWGWMVGVSIIHNLRLISHVVRAEILSMANANNVKQDFIYKMENASTNQ